MHAGRRGAWTSRAARRVAARSAPVEARSPAAKCPSGLEAIVATVIDGSMRPLDEQVAAAVRDGVRAEAAPVGRHLAEVRGMSVRAIRQLERIESTLGAE